MIGRRGESSRSRRDSGDAKKYSAVLTEVLGGREEVLSRSRRSTRGTRRSSQSFSQKHTGARRSSRRSCCRSTRGSRRSSRRSAAEAHGDQLEVLARSCCRSSRGSRRSSRRSRRSTGDTRRVLGALLAEAHGYT